MKTNKSKKSTSTKKATPAKKSTTKKAPTTKKSTTKVAPTTKKQAPTVKKQSAPAKKSVSEAPVTKSAPKNSAQRTQNGLVTVEIRIHNDAKKGHPHIKVDTVDGNIVSVGTTHDKFKGKNHPNIPLEQNPLGGKEKTYMRRQGTVDREENYSKTKKTGKMTVGDNAKAQQIGAKAKQKYLDSQKKKNKKA